MTSRPFSILVPLDGTAQAAVALPLARALARGLDAHLILTRVVPDTLAAVAAEAYLERIVPELASDGVEARSSIHFGRPEEAIVHAATTEQVGLIVMATHGRSGLQRAMLGSVAEGVLTHSKVPLVLLRPGGKRVTHIQTLLVPVDGTPGGSLALGSALTLARRLGARIVLAQVAVPTPTWIAGDAMGAGVYIDPAWDDEALTSAQVYVDSLAKRLQAAGVQAEGRAMLGDVTGSLVKMADEVDADLVVMSTHALTGPARTIIGSVADALVRTIHRPILLIRRETAESLVSLEGTAEPATAVGG